MESSWHNLPFLLENSVKENIKKVYRLTHLANTFFDFCAKNIAVTTF